MIMAQLRFALPAAALVGMAAPAAAQRQPTPDQQRIAALQQQLSASQAHALRLEQRLEAIERQLQQIVNRSEETGHRVNLLESGVQQFRTAQESRLTALETAAARAAEAAVQPAPVEIPAPAAKPALASTPAVAAKPVAAKAVTAASEPAGDPGEEAYSEGFRLWEAGKYDEAIAALRAFTAAFPTHRRVSWANNLTGRALLDKGDAHGAARVLLANYESNPKGGRAQDSLYYLGQALVKYGQPAEACKAYSELTSYYGGSVRADLKPLVAKARAESNCP